VRAERSIDLVGRDVQEPERGALGRGERPPEGPRLLEDVARRLAMSESDLYRKQRVAIENVARTISAMELEMSEDDPDPEAIFIQTLMTGQQANAE
jgi:hypothetical protein